MWTLTCLGGRQPAARPCQIGYDNRTGGAVAFTVSAPTQIAAGDNTFVTVMAVDALGNPVPGFLTLGLCRRLPSVRDAGNL
jgi:hypothetical protein